MALIDSLPKLAWLIMIFLVIGLGGAAISKFFDISFQAYGPYILWFLALGVLYNILPSNRKSIFGA